MSELKILVCGDVNGNFKALFSKVNSIVKKKGQFEYLFCVGNFFGSSTDEWEDVKSGKITVPLTTYVLGANELSHERFYTSTDLSSNIVYLGKKGCLTGSSGLKIAYLSGTESPASNETVFKSNKNKTNLDKDSKDSMYFSKEDVNDMISSLESESVIDILLTSQWPKDVTKYAVSLEEDELKVRNCSSALVSYLAKTLKPRFHFSGLAELYYERIPYRNHIVLEESPVHITRFIGMAPVSSLFQHKHKWLYAVNLAPACNLTRQQLIEYSGPATICPYDLIKSFDSNISQSQYFYNTATPSPKKYSRERADGYNERKKLCTIDSSKCWFCLSNSDVEKQLIISIGSHCYITLPKGVLVPEHVLIVPIKHALSSVELPDPVSDEVDKFKKSLACYYHDKGKDVVFFERNYSSPHLQIQAVPVPKKLEIKIQEELFSAAKDYDLDFTELPKFSNIQQVVSGKKPYFYFELMTNKSVEAKYLHFIHQKFPLQFGRVVLSSSEILNVADRVDWRKCQDTVEVERDMAERIRRNFAPYDFTKIE